MSRRLQALVSLLIMSALAVPLAAQTTEADPFYLRRLEAGKAAFSAGEHQQAADELRIAAFGLLDSPALLSETLARLAVAQQAAGRTEAASETIRRFVEVEAVARSYGKWTADDALHEAIVGLLKSAIPNDRLATIPTLARYHTSEEDRVMALTGRARTRSLTQAVEDDPDNPRWYVLLVRDAIERRDTRDAARWANRGLDVDPDNEDLLEISADLELRERRCEGALDLASRLDPFPGDLGERIFLCLAGQGEDDLAADVMARLDAAGHDWSEEGLAARRRAVPPIEDETPPAERPVRDIPPIINETPEEASVIPSEVTPSEEEALARASDLVRRGRVSEAKRVLLGLSGDDNSRELDRSLLEVAVLSEDWRLARRQISELTPFRRDEPIAIFYAAVTLYESDRPDDAKRLFEVARPQISDSDLVRRYERLIMSGER